MAVDPQVLDEWEAQGHRFRLVHCTASDGQPVIYLAQATKDVMGSPCWSTVCASRGMGATSVLIDRVADLVRAVRVLDDQLSFRPPVQPCDQGTQEPRP